MPDWPKCAKYPALECVCRGALMDNPTSGSCLRERNGDFTPVSGPQLGEGEAANESG